MVKASWIPNLFKKMQAQSGIFAVGRSKDERKNRAVLRPYKPKPSGNHRELAAESSQMYRVLIVKVQVCVMLKCMMYYFSHIPPVGAAHRALLYAKYSEPGEINILLTDYWVWDTSSEFADFTVL